MASYAIKVEGLSKRYTIGAYQGRYKSLRESLMNVVKAPFHRFRNGEKSNQDDRILWALKDISFTIEPGEVVGIIGRNGAGKSTLLKLLARITEPTQGEIRMRGRVGSLLEVGTGFHPELTGRENIFLNGAILGMSRTEIQRKFDAIVDFAEIEKFIDTPAKHYSSGMYMRLAFAVAAHLEPEILLVDEVLAVGDAQFQKKCLGKMGEVAKEGRTVLFVSHNMTAVSNLSDKGFLINKGIVEKTGNIIDVVSYYLNSETTQNYTDYSLESDEFNLLSLKIEQDGYSLQRFLSNHPLSIEFIYEIKHRAIKGLRVGFDILSSDNMLVFRTFDDDMESCMERKPGVYKSSCNIPQNFFLASDYYLTPRIGIHNVKWISDNDTRIKITFDQIEGVNHLYADRRPGIIMPALDWRIMPND